MIFTVLVFVCAIASASHSADPPGQKSNGTLPGQKSNGASLPSNHPVPNVLPSVSGWTSVQRKKRASKERSNSNARANRATNPSYSSGQQSTSAAPPANHAALNVLPSVSGWTSVQRKKRGSKRRNNSSTRPSRATNPSNSSMQRTGASSSQWRDHKNEDESSEDIEVSDAYGVLSTIESKESKNPRLDSATRVAAAYLQASIRTPISASRKEVLQTLFGDGARLMFPLSFLRRIFIMKTAKLTALPINKAPEILINALAKLTGDPVFSFQGFLDSFQFNPDPRSLTFWRRSDLDRIERLSKEDYQIVMAADMVLNHMISEDQDMVGDLAILFRDGCTQAVIERIGALKCRERRVLLHFFRKSQ